MGPRKASRLFCNGARAICACASAAESSAAAMRSLMPDARCSASARAADAADSSLSAAALATAAADCSLSNRALPCSVKGSEGANGSRKSRWDQGAVLCYD